MMGTYRLVRRETRDLADQDRRDLLAALGDDTQSALLEHLVAGACTQAQLQEACALSASVVSRGLAHLRALGLIGSGRGRDALHELLAEQETLGVIDAAGLLQAAILDRRARAMRARASGAAPPARRPHPPGGEKGSGREGA
jgi:hypothetical protein